MKNVWDEHYERPKSKLAFPDENLVRLLSRIQPKNRKALDFGCGSGRHSYLLEKEGYLVTGCDNAKTTIDQLNEESPSIRFLHTPNTTLPFSPKEFGLIVSWGVFHYNKREDAKNLLSNLYDSLDTGGYLLGSIRADGDTHLGLRQGKMNLKDLNGGYAETYSLEDLKSFLSIFSKVSIGYSERTPLGKLEERICHWFFLAEK
ncbi:class I SAM-dependent methyltransferase [Leptospira sp. 2 VSF19]|uniref:Class I SAM-dependent methyltransferase n=1 Tax=Leptospira soteropolitanensis TaxID=2950025 RepID=A0AAW5VIL3_9LEPT|nr:class I SAM-dependent methyltransferase [Leptospira soteropolitanensis]MCW7492347.1 class I SAM-dependent methyltransferase [Leptospira soteropolitanensis]MCW7499929.1 class I SAM-dependent methyltransferase [Leptospira soteropolitanensis]MCW7522180.1 class I SAM-dependent methyltransferase [Leptospira soteropolitanensis]MCW7526034.1 class I SAM-dependent methyltransferase [Leptospira soteropolitanensis]MCW7529852.1 class I SAM-dependent methyltransferase [Leptospira soteropolitanensis]